MVKEISHLLGRDIAYQTLSKASEVSDKTEDVSRSVKALEDALLVAKHQMQDRMHIIQKNTEMSQEFLSNEYAALYNWKSTSRPRVLICGFYGAKNVGDELMLEALLGLLPENKLDITILLSNNYDIDAAEYAPFRVLHYPKYSSDVLAIAHNFDAVIWGGGAMLDDVDYEYRGQYSTMAYILMSITKAVLKCGGQAFVYGVSSNKKLMNNKFLQDLQYVVDNSDYFALRDSNSLESLKKAGINTKKIAIIDDLSIAGIPSGYVSKKRSNDNNVLNVGINLIVSDNGINEATRVLKKIADVFEKPINIIMIPFYNYKDHDQKLINDLIRDVKIKGVKITMVNQPNTMRELLDIYDKLDYIFTMRYHASLIAALTHNNVIMIDYEDRHSHYHNKNDYIKPKYCKELKVIKYDDLCKDGEFGELGALNESERVNLEDIRKEIATIVNNTVKKIRKVKNAN